MVVWLVSICVPNSVFNFAKRFYRSLGQLFPGVLESLCREGSTLSPAAQKPTAPAWWSYSRVLGGCEPLSWLMWIPHPGTGSAVDFLFMMPEDLSSAAK